MALVKCKECGSEVSSEAKVCLKCGAKPQGGIGILAKLVMGVIGLLILGSVFGRSPSTGTRDARTTPTENSSLASVAPAKVYSEKERATALAKMSVKTDKVEGDKWYRDRSTSESIDRNAFYIYAGEKESQVWLRFVVRYSSSDWIFFDRIIVNADGDTFEFSAPSTQQHVGDGYVSEWLDVSVDDASYRLINAVAHSKKATIRLKGRQFDKDREITASEKKAILNVLEAYRVLGGKTF